MKLEDREHYLRTFEDQLYDSVYLLYFAFDTNQEEYKNNVISTFIRSSIINSVILLESGANCLIDALELKGQYYSDIEKLPFLSKYEFFLNTKRPKLKFDRGCKEVQSIAELKSIRDFYVHPKVRTSRYEKINENLWDTDYGHTKQISFPRDPSRWKKEHAILALKSVNDFFNKYFVDWCEFSPNLVVDLLLSSDKVSFEHPSGAAIDCIGGLNRAVTEWNIDFKFIGKNV